MTNQTTIRHRRMEVEQKLGDIIFLATACMHDMQGRLQDDGHKRAFAILQRITALAREGLGYE